MATRVTMPQLGETVVEGTVSRWLKAPGDAVTRMEPLLEISTDKIDTEVPAPADGTLLEIIVGEGETVRAGTVLAVIGAAGESVPAVTEKGTEKAADKVSEKTETKQEQKRSVSPPTDGAASSAQPKAQAVEPSDRPSGRAFVSPVVARIAAEHSVDLDQISGTGMGSRVTKKDILAYVEARSHRHTPEPQPVQAPVPVAAPQPESARDEIWQPLTTMRRFIAQHMVASKQTSPHVTTVFEADMTAVVLHRERHKADYAAKGIRLTFTPYFVAAAAAALKAVPEMNSRFVEDGERVGLAQNRRIHIGVAVALEDGLIVPVIRDADERNLQGLARAVNEVAEQARIGKLPPDATRGGSFTITNHGVTGSLLGTPIINQPQSGILGIGAIVKRPVVQSRSLLPSADDAIVIRPMCYLSLSFDHRVLDGARADAFMTVVVKQLEHWMHE